MEPKRGLFAGGGTTVRLPRQLAVPGGDGVPAHRRGVPRPAGARARAAQRDRRPRTSCWTRAHDWAGRITANAPLAVQATKESVLRGLALPTRRRPTRSSRSSPARCSRARTPRRARRRSPRSASPIWTGPVSGVDPAHAVPHRRGAAHVAPERRARRPSRWSCGTRSCRRGGRATPARRGDVLDAVDSLQIVYCQSWQYDDPAGRLADALGIDPAPPPLLRHRRHDAAGARAGRGRGDRSRGELRRRASIAGAEALETMRQAEEGGRAAGVVATATRSARRSRSRRRSTRPRSPTRCSRRGSRSRCATSPAGPTSASRPTSYRRQLGELLAPMTEVAAANPYAWFPVERTAEELVTPTAENRMVGYPYTKYMVSVMDVDMAAAVIVAPATTRPTRSACPPSGACTCGAGATPPTRSTSPSTPTCRRSPAMAAASAEALAARGRRHRRRRPPRPLQLLRQLGALRPRRARARRRRRPRAVTVTGGLPFAGGAGSDYMTALIATMADVLRDDPGSVGLVAASACT